MSGSRKLMLPEEVRKRSIELPDWTVLDGKKLSRDFRFEDFKGALAIVNRIGEIAETQGHHPDIRLAWGSVGVETWTHDAGGLTDQDFLLAASINQLSATL